MTDSKNRQWILNARPAGKLTGEEFLWNEALIPRPSDGQVLIRTLWLSVDPAQRIWMARDSYKPAVPLGDVMQSFAVGQVRHAIPPDREERAHARRARPQARFLPAEAPWPRCCRREGRAQRLFHRPDRWRRRYRPMPSADHAARRGVFHAWPSGGGSCFLY